MSLIGLTFLSVASSGATPSLTVKPPSAAKSLFGAAVSSTTGGPILSRADALGASSGGLRYVLSRITHREIGYSFTGRESWILTLSSKKTSIIYTMMHY